jgi:hypothetical protein
MESIPEASLGPLHVATNGDVWIGVEGGRRDARIFALQIHQSEWTFYPLRSSDAQIGRVLSITSTADGRVWLSVENFLGPGRLLCFGDGEWSEVKVPLLYDAPVMRPKSFPNRTCAQKLVSEGNRVWAVMDPNTGLPVARLMTFDPSDSVWADSQFLKRDACVKTISGGQAQGQIWVAEWPCPYIQPGRLHRFVLD